jgi:GT2 family glycosyltransferase
LPRPATLADYRRRLDSGSRVVRQAPVAGRRAPFFSVLTVTLDRAAPLARAMRSLQAQEERDFEHVVVDGGSSDGTLALLQDRSSRVDAWLSEPDLGIADALNKAVSLASGEWIVLLHSDDQLAPGALRHWRQMAESAGDADVLSCAIRYVEPDGRPTHDVLPDPGGIERRMSMPHPGMAVRRALYERIGAFRTDFRVAMDYEFTLRALKQGARFRCDPTVVCLMQTGGISQRGLLRSRGENLRAQARWLGLRPWMLAQYGRETIYLLRARLNRHALRRFLQGPQK